MLIYLHLSFIISLSLCTLTPRWKDSSSISSLRSNRQVEGNELYLSLTRPYYTRPQDFSIPNYNPSNTKDNIPSIRIVPPSTIHQKGYGFFPPTSIVSPPSHQPRFLYPKQFIYPYNESPPSPPSPPSSPSSSSPSINNGLIPPPTTVIYSSSHSTTKSPLPYPTNAPYDVWNRSSSISSINYSIPPSTVTLQEENQSSIPPSTSQSSMTNPIDLLYPNDELDYNNDKTKSQPISLQFNTTITSMSTSNILTHNKAQSNNEYSNSPSTNEYSNPPSPYDTQTSKGYSNPPNPYETASTQGYSNPPSPYETKTSKGYSNPPNPYDTVSIQGYSNRPSPYETKTSKGYSNPPNPYETESTHEYSNPPSPYETKTSKGYSNPPNPYETASTQGYSNPPSPYETKISKGYSNPPNPYETASTQGHSNPPDPYETKTSKGYSNPPNPYETASTQGYSNPPSPNETKTSKGYSNPPNPYETESTHEYSNPPSPYETKTSKGYSNPPNPYETASTQGYSNPPSPYETKISKGYSNPPNPYDTASTQGYSNPPSPYETKTSKGYSNPPNPYETESTHEYSNPPSPYETKTSKGYSNPPNPYETASTQGYSNPPSPYETKIFKGYSNPPNPYETASTQGYSNPPSPYETQTSKGFSNPPNPYETASTQGYSNPPSPYETETSKGYNNPPNPYETASTHAYSNPPSPYETKSSKGYSNPPSPYETKTSKGYSSPPSPYDTESTKGYENWKNDSRPRIPYPTLTSLPPYNVSNGPIPPPKSAIYSVDCPNCSTSSPSSNISVYSPPKGGPKFLIHNSKDRQPPSSIPYSYFSTNSTPPNSSAYDLPPPPPGSNHEIKEYKNRIKGMAHVLCMDKGVEVNGLTVKPFEGYIATIGDDSNKKCIHSFDGSSTNISIFFSYEECGKRNSHNMEEWETHVLIDFSTHNDSFLIQCQEQTIQDDKNSLPRRFEESLEEFELIPIKIEQKAPLPSIEWKLTENNETEVDIGTSQKMIFNLYPQTDAYGIHVKNCFVVDVKNGDRHSVIDRKGCSTDMAAFSHPEYIRYIDEIRSDWMVFKLPDTDYLHVECSIFVCPDIPSSNGSYCSTLSTPPLCPRMISSPINSLTNYQTFAKRDTEGDMTQRVQTSLPILSSSPSHIISTSYTCISPISLLITLSLSSISIIIATSLHIAAPHIRKI